VNRHARIAALLVASMSLVGGCTAVTDARDVRYTETTQTPSSIAVPNPVGPARAARDAADEANDAARDQQQTLDGLSSP
jgi:hypothetical protein